MFGRSRLKKGAGDARAKGHIIASRANNDRPPKDWILLVITALLVCVAGGAAFWLADLHHVSPLWIFLLFNSIGIIALR